MDKTRLFYILFPILLCLPCVLDIHDIRRMLESHPYAKEAVQLVTMKTRLDIQTSHNIDLQKAVILTKLNLLNVSSMKKDGFI